MDQRKLQEFLIFNRYSPDLYALPSMPVNEGITPGLNPNGLYHYYTNLHDDVKEEFLVETKNIPKDQVGRGKNEKPTSPITIQNLFEKLNHEAYKLKSNSPLSGKAEVDSSSDKEDSVASSSTSSVVQGSSPANLESQGNQEEDLSLSNLKRRKRPWLNQEDTAKFKFY